MSLPDPAFWAGRRVLLTGHTGFKGAWLACWLQRLGAQVLGVSLPEPVSTPSLWDALALPGVHDVRADVADPAAWQGEARDFAPEVVLHLAAQPLVAVGWSDPVRTWTSNVQGTVAVMALAEQLPDLQAVLVITTDKVYDPVSRPPHREASPLGGHDPYSASKAAVELVVGAWPETAPRGTARAGNVIGGGDWAHDRLLPDLVRAWADGRPAVLRNPAGVRPWQHVVEPLRGYLLYAQALASGTATAPALNFGPSDAQSVRVDALVEHAVASWDGAPSPAWTTTGEPAYAETGELTLDSALAREVLGWTGVLDWRAAVDLTLAFYRDVLAGADPAALVAAQFDQYAAAVEESP